MLTLTLDVNGRVINIVKIVNRGPIDKEYADGDGPGGGGIRRYEWTALNGAQGLVHHARSDGAEALAAKVLADMNPQVSDGVGVDD